MNLDVDKLLKQTESETLDFKQAFHVKNASFVHDFICLANSDHGSNKYLIFGIKEKDGVIEEVVGIENDPNKKNLQQISNILQSSFLNSLPNFSYQEFIYKEHTVGILEIKPSALKPFFLLKDKVEGKVRIRAGVMYSRLGDTNTPIDSCPDNSTLEQMWKTRFNLDKTPLERLEILLGSPEEWEPGFGQGQVSTLHHNQHPEFTILINSSSDQKIDGGCESWMKGFPDPDIYLTYIYLNYNYATLKSIRCGLLDGCRYILPFPQYLDFEDSTKKKRVFYILKTSIEYKLLNFSQKLNFIPLEERRLDGMGYYIVDSNDELSFKLKGFEWQPKASSSH